MPRTILAAVFKIFFLFELNDQFNTKAVVAALLASWSLRKIEVRGSSLNISKILSVLSGKRIEKFNKLIRCQCVNELTLVSKRLN